MALVQLLNDVIKKMNLKDMFTLNNLYSVVLRNACYPCIYTSKVFNFFLSGMHFLVYITRTENLISVYLLLFIKET